MIRVLQVEDETTTLYILKICWYADSRAIALRWQRAPDAEESKQSDARDQLAC